MKNHPVPSAELSTGFCSIYLRQHRIIQVCGLRGQIFRQCVQIISSHTDVWVLIFGHNDGTICKQGVRRELCGAALIINSLCSV